MVYAPNMAAVATGTNCRLTNNLLFPQPTAIPNNVSADPQLVNPTGGDYHLKPTSPAIDVAAATGDFPMAAPDLDGTGRPQGAKPDVGAFERTP